MDNFLTRSWVIVNKATGEAVFETFNKSTADKINTDIYSVLPALVYLQQFNAKVKSCTN